MKYKVEYEIEFDGEVKEEDFDKGQRLHGTRYGTIGGYMFRMPKDAKVERVPDPLPVGTVIRSKDGSILEWKAGDGRWYWIGTEPDGSGKEVDRSRNDEAVQRSVEDYAAYEFIYKPEA